MGLETISYRAPELWNLFPTEIKAIDIQGENKVMGLWQLSTQFMQNTHCQCWF